VCLAEYNVEQRVDGLVNYTLSTWAPWFQNAGPGGDVMYTMGEDFQWSNATSSRLKRCRPGAASFGQGLACDRPML
jgi:hypothetical protein